MTSNPEADELGHASVVVSAFFDGAEIIAKSVSSKSKRRRSSPSIVKRCSFRDFLERAAHEIQHAHDAGIAKHGIYFDEGDGASREILLSTAIDMHISVLRILEIACEHEKDTRLLDHMHDIADSNRHLAVKALNDLSNRLNWSLSARSPPRQPLNSRYSNTARSRASNRLSSQSIAQLIDQQTRQPVYAPNLAKLKATHDSYQESNRPTSIGHPSIGPGSVPLELEGNGMPLSPQVPWSLGGHEREEPIVQAQAPRRKNTAILPYRWLRAVLCMRSASDAPLFEEVKSDGPKAYVPATASPQDLQTSQPRVYAPAMPAVEMPADSPMHPHGYIPAIAELDDRSSIDTVLSVNGSSEDNITQTCDTPATLFSEDGLSKRPSTDMLTPRSPDNLSPVVEDLSMPFSPNHYIATQVSATDSSRGPQTQAGTYNHYHHHQQHSHNGMSELPGAATPNFCPGALLTQSDNAKGGLHLVSDGLTTHWRCKHCTFASPGFTSPYITEAITSTSDLTVSGGGGHSGASLAVKVDLPTDIVIHRGICYRWRFLLASHCPASGVVNYGCIFCAHEAEYPDERARGEDLDHGHGLGLVEGHEYGHGRSEDHDSDCEFHNGGDAHGHRHGHGPGRGQAQSARIQAQAQAQVQMFGTVDRLLAHVNACHAGSLSDHAQIETRCVDGRIADDLDETWDVNICLFE